MESTGITYPTIEIGGKSYEIKFTGATLFTLQENGIQFAPRFEPNQNPADTKWRCEFNNLIKTLKVCIGWRFEIDTLANLVFPIRDEAFTKLMEAWGNLMLPSIQLKLRETAAKQAEPTSPEPAVQ